MKPIKVLFGFALFMLWLAMIPTIPSYYANTFLIGILTLLFVLLLIACLIED